MNFRTTYILFGVLVALFAVLGVVLFLGPSPKKGADALFPSAKADATKLEPDDFTRVVIQRLDPADEEIVLEKDGKDWRVVAPRALAADPLSISSLLRDITSAKVDKDTKPRGRKESGLDKPSRVLLFDAKDRQLKLTLGATAGLENDAIVFAESSDRPGELLAVKKSELRTALEGLAAFRGKELLGDTGDLSSIKLTMGKKLLELKKEKGNWRFVRPDYGEADASGLVTALAGLNVTHIDDKTSDFVKDAVKPEELAKVTNDASRGDALRVEVTPQKGKPAAAIIWVSKKDGEKFFAAAEDAGKTRDVVKVMATNPETLVKALNDPTGLRNKTLVSLEATPDAIDVRNSYGLLEFRKPERALSWELYRDGKAIKVEDAQVRLLIDALKKKDLAVSFHDLAKKKELGLEAANAIEVKVYADSLDKPDDKKPGKPAIKKGAEPAAVLRFGNEVGANVAVERVLMKDIVMVPSDVLLKQVKAGPLGYFDKSVPPFNTGSAEDNVTKLELTRPGEVVQVVREKDGAPWTFVKPDKLKGRKASGTAVNDILDALNRPKVAEIAAEKADAKELGPAYGLDTPTIRATVTVTEGGKPKTHSFDLGRMTGKGFFARVAGNPMVYVFEGSVADTLKKELRDMSVLDFDIDKVASVTIKGYKNLLGSVYVLSADRDGRKWVVKSPAGFMLDAEKLEKFLTGVSRLQAEKFIPAGKTLTPEEGGFQVTITLADKDRSVLVLNVGAEEGGSFTATSSQLKGDAFMVPKELFGAPREKPAYFSK